MAVGFLMFNLWKAKLISFLAQRTIVLPFDGVESLILTSDYNIFVSPGTAHEDKFRFAKTPLWQKAWTERVEPNFDAYEEYMKSVNCKQLVTFKDCYLHNTIILFHF